MSGMGRNGQTGGRRRCWVFALALCVAASLSLQGCSADDAATADAAGLDAGAGAQDGGTLADGGAHDGAHDGAALTDAADTAKPAGTFELGTNVTGKNTRMFYTAVPNGTVLNVELGPQGLWMVVLAFKTQGLLKDPLYLSGSIVIDGNDAAGQLALKKQKTILSDDGFNYYYNFWLVVKNDKLPLPSAPAGVAGKTATITLEITDVDQKKHIETRTVMLKGGPNG